MTSSSGTSLFKRETVKSESVKLEFGRKIDLSAIPRAPTAAPVSVKAQETKDVKAVSFRAPSIGLLPIR